MGHNRAGEHANRVETLDLLGGYDELGAIGSFVKITLDNEDLVARPIGVAGFSRSEKGPKNGIWF